MVIRNPGSIFQYDSDSPSSTVSGSKSRAAHRWKYCPYSTQSVYYNQDSRIPLGEKTYHPETEGRMHTWSHGGPLGWVCADNACPYFLGTASTEVQQATREFMYLPSGTYPRTEADWSTASGTVDHSTTGRTLVSGTRYYEI